MIKLYNLFELDISNLFIVPLLFKLKDPLTFVIRSSINLFFFLSFLSQNCH